MLQMLEINDPEAVRAVRIGLSQGKKFIWLRHKESNRVRTALTGVDCLRVIEQFDMRAGGVVAGVRQTQGEAPFIPDVETYQRYCPMLDTDLNRDVLATHLREARWDILDEGILADIQERQQRIEKERGIVHDTSRTKISVAAQQVIIPPKEQYKNWDKVSLNAEIERKKRELKEMSAAANELSLEPTAETSHITQTPYGMSYIDAKKEVHKKHHALLTELRKSHPRNWWRTKEYLTKVQPEIEALTNIPAPQVVQPEGKPESAAPQPQGITKPQGIAT
jgi:hypothetical protein